MKLCNVTSTRQYTDNNGETRYVNTQHGTLFLKHGDDDQNPDYVGEILLDSLPIGANGQIRLRVWVRTPRENGQQTAQGSNAPVQMSMDD